MSNRMQRNRNPQCLTTQVNSNLNYFLKIRKDHNESIYVTSAWVFLNNFAFENVIKILIKIEFD